jgi:hypothetical protein
MLFNLHENQVIFPSESKQVQLWAKKWGVNAQQLNEAILYTGTIKRKALKTYLEKKGIIFSFSGTIKKMRVAVRRIAMKFTEEE